MAALVGTVFIDWTVYRSTFEVLCGACARSQGHRARGGGSASCCPRRPSVFPMCASAKRRIRFSWSRKLQHAHVELPPLLKGEIRVIDMELDRPHLSLALDEDGRLDWLTAMTSDGALANLPPEDLAFEKVTIRDGALSIVDARSGETHRIDNGNLAVSARTLAGPFKACRKPDARTARPTTSASPRAARQEDFGIRIKGELTPTDWPVNFGFDGMLQQADAAPCLRRHASTSLPSCWTKMTPATAGQAEGQLQRADIAEVAVPEFEFRYGPEDRRLSMTGKCRPGLCRGQTLRGSGQVKAGGSRPAARRRAPGARRDLEAAGNTAGC